MVNAPPNRLLWPRLVLGPYSLYHRALNSTAAHGAAHLAYGSPRSQHCQPQGIGVASCGAPLRRRFDHMLKHE